MSQQTKTNPPLSGTTLTAIESLGVQRKVDLASYVPVKDIRGASKLKSVLWYATSLLFFRSYFFPFYKIKSLLLRMFGAKVGLGLVIKPNVNIKYPWKLSIGNNCWIGEEVWIDNLAQVTIDNNVCISQGAMLLTGNHDFSKVTFNLITRSIHLEDGVWIGAKAMVCPGVTCKSHSILSVMSVATKDLVSYTLFQGNPAQPIKHRAVY